MVIKNKMKAIANKTAKIASCASALMAYFPTVAFAAGSGESSDGFFTHEVSVDPNNVDATTMMGKLLGVISVVFIIVGIFRCGTAAFTILEAYSEDNSAAINKGVKQLAIGAVFIAAPLLMQFLFGGSN